MGLLHNTRSNSSFLGVSRKSFFKLFFVKDLISWSFYFLVFLAITHVFINQLRDVENFLSADPLVTPLHIKPEWYFLFAYAILRKSRTNSSNIGVFILSFFILTVTRRMPVEDPYVLISQITSVTYFMSYLI